MNDDITQEFLGRYLDLMFVDNLMTQGWRLVAIDPATFDLQGKYQPEWALIEELAAKCKANPDVLISWFWAVIELWKLVHYTEIGTFPEFNEPNLAKSCLLRRMLILGKPPMPYPPPTIMAAPAYELAEEAESEGYYFRRFVAADENNPPAPHPSGMSAADLRASGISALGDPWAD